MLAKLCNFLVGCLQLAFGLSFLYDGVGILQAAGAPLDDKTKYVPYGTATMFHGLRLYSISSIGWGLFILLYGGSRTSFLFLMLATVLTALEEKRYLDEAAILGASEKHLEGIKGAFYAQVAASMVSLLGFLSAKGETKQNSKSKQQ